MEVLHKAEAGSVTKPLMAGSNGRSIHFNSGMCQSPVQQAFSHCNEHLRLPQVSGNSTHPPLVRVSGRTNMDNGSCSGWLKGLPPFSRTESKSAPAQMDEASPHLAGGCHWTSTQPCSPDLVRIRQCFPVLFFPLSLCVLYVFPSVCVVCSPGCGSACLLVHLKLLYLN